ncbi:Platelet-activating factor acetylhydrolase, isoform II [Granulicella rosea]|uniref:Platelet-activating factor acetylhydrolase, isoform II n=1 Tax=Granulicella rosea TaxID=474952 RepID=A0A239DNZ2_9BACT|nr:hypothetical protein [Granulicella rosea]SNS33801.1 Platelet-activating factor acetylhydrolase, isoform II [Granulicella rosea]
MTQRYSYDPPRRWGLWRLLAALACVAAASALALMLIVKRHRLPAPTGPYAVGTRILDMTDTSRHADGVAGSAAGGSRQLVAQIWYPALPSQQPVAAYKRWREVGYKDLYEPLVKTNSRWDAPVAPDLQRVAFPVLIFGHSWGGERVQNTALAEDLASHGYIVLAVDHPYNSGRVLLQDGRVIAGSEPIEGPLGASATAEQQIDYWNATLDIWAADDLFALNRLAALNADADDPLHGRVDTNIVGAYGHSFGGAASLRLCGLDPRIKAAVNLDGWTFGALASRTSAQPVLIFYEQVSVGRRDELAKTPPPGTVEDQKDRADFAAVDRSFARYGGTRLFVRDTQHLDFSDQPLLPPLHRGHFTGPIAPARVDDILRQTVLAFFDQSLRGKPSKLLADPHAVFPEVTAEVHETAANP